MRAVAAEAGVDQALIAHYFGSKHQLFIAAVEFPLDPAMILPEILAGDRSTIGERLAQVQLTLLEDPEARRRLTGLVRAASCEPDAARMLREFLMREVIGPVAEALGPDEPELRVSLVGSQIIGLMMARYIAHVEPLPSLPRRATRPTHRTDAAALPHATAATGGVIVARANRAARCRSQTCRATPAEQTDPGSRTLTVTSVGAVCLGAFLERPGVRSRA